MTTARARHSVDGNLLLRVFTASVRARDSTPPSILRVTLGATRADRVGAYGYDIAVSPTLDRLARQGPRGD